MPLGSTALFVISVLLFVLSLALVVIGAQTIMLVTFAGVALFVVAMGFSIASKYSRVER